MDPNLDPKPCSLTRPRPASSARPAVLSQRALRDLAGGLDSADGNPLIEDELR
jgi:hypothetical protein